MRYPAHHCTARLTAEVQRISPSSQIFAPLLSGVPSFLVPPTLLSEPQAFLQLLTIGRVTRLVAVPAFLRLLIAATIPNHHPDPLPPLSLLVSSGEPLSVGLWRELCDTFLGVRVLNLYGMTEAAADSTCFDPEEAVRVGAWACPHDPDAHLPIGCPIQSTWVALVDEDMQLITSDDRTGCVGLGLSWVWFGFRHAASVSSSEL